MVPDSFGQSDLDHWDEFDLAELMICCDKESSDCDCESWIWPSAVYDVPLGQAYAPDNDESERTCQTCWHQGEPSCPSLRAWIRQKKQGLEPSVIAPCGHWVANDLVSDNISELLYGKWDDE